MKILWLSLFVTLFSVPLGATQGGEHAAEKCVLEGQIVKAPTGEPLAKAQVLLQKAEARTQTVTMVTDSSGRFVFTDIEPGRYRLSARHNGYVPQRYGQRGPQHPGTVLSLAPGQRVREVVFRLIPHGVITGRVYDETGEPLPGARVQVLRSLYVRGERQLIPTRASETNDLGEYRIYGLAPGRYYVSATYEAPAASPQIGPERGRDPGTPGEAYAVTLYPGTNDPLLASPIIEGIRLIISRGVELTGRVFVEDGRPVQAGTPAGGQEQLDMSQLRVFLEPKEHAPLGGLSPAQLKSDGTFRLENVAWERYSLNLVGLQGDYYLKAARLGGTDVLDQGLSLTGAAPPGSLELLLSPGGAHIEGTVVNSDGQPVAGAVVLLAPETRSRHRNDLFKTTTADQHGRFAFRGITPLEYTLLAWEEIEPGVYQDPSFLRFYEKQGRVVRLQPTDRMAFQLLAIPPGEAIW